jgi:hypothetical protein
VSLVADAAYVAEVLVIVPLSGAVVTGWTANHAREIAASWRDGVERLAEWRDWLAAVRPDVVVARWLAAVLLAVVPPGHGAHRRPGVAR